MKKIRLLSVLLLSFLSAACSDIVEELATLHLDIEKLKVCETELNATVASLEKIVSSISIHFIAEVTPILDDSGVCLGYTLVYDDGHEVQLFYGEDGANGHNGRSGVDGRDGSNGYDGWDGRDGRDGKDGRDGEDGADGKDGADGEDGADGKDGVDGADGKDGEDGKDGNSPVMGVAQDTDGKWYWTIDGSWMLDASGARIPVSADGVTPKMKIENGWWYYSYDNGLTWTSLCSATENTPSIFKAIDYTSNYEYVLLTLNNGTVLRLPRCIDLDVSFTEQESHPINSLSPVKLEYSVSGGKGSCKVECVASGGLETVIDTLTGNSGTVTVSAPKDFGDGKVMVFLHKHNRTFMKAYSFSLKYEGLSSDGASNCYMVHEPGDYSFYAMVKGCTDEQLDGEPEKAAVLWESFSTDETPYVGALVRSVRFADGYVSFSIPQPMKEGNAVIALKDSSDNILWSWHIWITQYDPSDDYAVYESHPGTHVMMRNLGALVQETEDPRSIGMYYQWGRKDPFLGLSSRDNTSKFAAASVIFPEPVASGKNTGRVSYTTLHPMTFVKRNSNYSGWNPFFDSVWGEVKSQSDPCPPGWQVPYYDGKWYEICSYGEYVGDRCGKRLSQPYSVPESWIPCSGYIYGESGRQVNRVGNEAYLWACRTESDDSYAPLFSHFNYNGWSSRAKSDACPVRCITQ